MMTNVAFMGKTCAGKNPFRRLAALGMCLFVSMLTFAAEREKVVFVVAHPDDLAQPSGTALLLSQKYDVKVVDYTRGENGIDEKGYRDGSTGRLRVAEERAACKFLNTEPIFLSCVNYRGHVCETKKRLMACYVCQNASDIIARKTADDIFRGRRVGLWMAEAFAVYEGSIKNGCGVLDDLPSRR